MGSIISPLDIFLAAFPIKNNGLVISLDVMITMGIITINIIILINTILFLALLILVFKDCIDSEVLIIMLEFSTLAKIATYNISSLIVVLYLCEFPIPFFIATSISSRLFTPL